MQSISLAEAYKRKKNIKLSNAYISSSRDTLSKDEKKLATKIVLLDKILTAEKISGILDLRNKIKLVEYQYDFYLNDSAKQISKEDRKYIAQQLEYCNSDLKYLNELLEEKLKVVEIEI